VIQMLLSFAYSLSEYRPGQAVRHKWGPSGPAVAATVLRIDPAGDGVIVLEDPIAQGPVHCHPRWVAPAIDLPTGAEMGDLS
jgi:hypothetical protein